MMRSNKGYTLTETLVSATLTTLVLGAIVLATQRGIGLFEESSANSEINSRASRTCYRVLEDLRGAGAGSIFPDLTTPAGGPVTWSSTIDFRQADQWQAGAVVWGPLLRIGMELAPGELDNGLDDNGNGLIDEQIVVRTENPGAADERRIVLVSDVRELAEGELPNAVDDNGNGLVDESGLSFDLQDGVLTMRMSLEALGPAGPITRTQETTLALRN